MDELVTRYLNDLKTSRGRAANTIASYRRDLNQAVDFFNQQGISSWPQVDQYAIFDLVAAQKEQGRSTATINRRLSTLRQFFRYLVRQREIKFNPMEMVDNEQAVTAKQPVILSEDEVRQLLKAPAVEDQLGQRDYALLGLMAATGMRVSEVVALSLTDLHLDIKMVRLGRGSKRERLVPVSATVAASLNGYLKHIRPQLASNGENAVFVNAHGHRLTRQGIWKNLKSRVQEAGIDKDVTPQTLRYSFAVHLLRNGADSRLVQGMLGNSEMRVLKPFLKMTAQELSANYEQYQPWK